MDCSGAGAGTFPEFERSCKSNADCAAVAHQFNCCGSERITGVRAVQVDAFKTAEATCRGQYPGCGCATQSPVADDGSAAGGGNPGPVAVACNAGTCETSFSSDATTPCGPELSCDAATEICVAREPVGPAITYTCEPAAAGCYNARGCACSAAALCTGGFNTCHDDAVNKITCECQLCQ